MHFIRAKAGAAMLAKFMELKRVVAVYNYKNNRDKCPFEIMGVFQGRQVGNKGISEGLIGKSGAIDEGLEGLLGFISVLGEKGFLKCGF